MERLVLRRVVLLGTPLALAILEIFHPDRPNSASEAVEQGVWFMWFHFIQVPLIGFIALAAAGIGTGYALRNAQGLSAGAQEAIYEAVKDMPVVSLIFGLSIVGTGAWVVALIAAARALRGAGASFGPFILLILAGVFLMGGHPYPAGTLAFGSFFLAAAWLEFAPGRLTSASQPLST